MAVARTVLGLSLSAILLSLSACGDTGDESEDVGGTESAISGTLTAGQSLKTTARLNLREGPSTSDDVIRTLGVGTIVTVIDGAPTNGFYHVEADGEEGWSFGTYLKSSTTPTTNPGTGAGTDNEGTGTPTGAGETCKASFYDEGQQTANGERFNPEALTAAHKTLRFNTKVRVTNPTNGKSVVVRINDRGPFIQGRCLDLSRAAFRTIGSLGAGVMTVRYEVLQ